MKEYRKQKQHQEEIEEMELKMKQECRKERKDNEKKQSSIHVKLSK